MTSNRKNEDRLSNFPEDILTHIISLLQFKLAVRTSILSKRWRYSWMLVSNLEFDNVTPYESVDKVLELRKSKVEILRLHFSKVKVPKPTVSKWINEAIRLNVSELDIRYTPVDLPLSLFTCKTLTTFRFRFHSLYKPLWTCPSLVSLPCLKTLDIAIYSNPLEDAFKLIHGCPILENLSLEVTCQKKYVEDYYFEIPTLKRLALSLLISADTIHKVVLNVPNLEYLSIWGSLLRSIFVIKDLSSLVEAKVSCVTVDDHLWYELELLKGISKAKCLSLDIPHSLESINPLSSSLPEFSNVKQLDLWGFDGCAWLLVPKFLERCSELEHFSIHKPLQYSVCPSEEPGSVPSCMLANLKTIKVTISMGKSGVLQLLKFMLANSKVLKRLIVAFDDRIPLNVEGSLSKDISMLTRASKDCEFHFVSKMPHARTP